VTIEHVKSISFEALVVLLRDKPVIAAMKAGLQRMHLLATFRHGSPSKSLAPENVNVRVFLAAYMIAYRPTHVFESMGTLEQALFESAVPLLNQFQTMSNTLLAAPYKHFQMVPSDQTKDFPMALFEYLKRFKAWKVPDEAKLTCRIKNALVALYQAEQHLPPDEPEDSKLKIEFRTQIARLRSKLQQIAGQEALDKFDEDRLIGAPVAENGAAGSSSYSSNGAYAALPGRMTNEQLAHQLLLDPTFQLDETGGCSSDYNPVFSRIRESFHRAFWDSLVDDLRLPTPCYVRVLRVLGEIRDGIKDLTGAREEGCIADVLDLDFIKDQVDKGLYDFCSATKLVEQVVLIIRRAQAPKRDGETGDKWRAMQEVIGAATKETEARVMCDCLEFLLNRVNVMRIDAANARLRLIAPVIKDHGIDYERGKFADKLKDGTLTLSRTEAWFLSTMMAEKELTVRARGGCRVSAMKLHASAVVSLVSRTEPVRAETAPETLLFDVPRLAALQNEFALLVAVETVLYVLATRNDSELLRVTVEKIKAMEPDTELDIAVLGLPDAVAKHVEHEMRPGSGVGNAIRKQICTLLRENIVQTAPVACVLRRAKIAHDVRRIGVINREIHAAAYDRMIRDLCPAGF
jgi:hypothetical protein